MEKKYLTSLCNTIRITTSGIKGALENPTKVVTINKDVVKHPTGVAAPSRAHDLWAKGLAKPKAEERMQDAGSAVNGKEPPLTLEEEWELEFAEVKRIHGAKHIDKTT